MSEVPPNPPQKTPLHRLAKPQPKATDKPTPSEPGVGSGSATGFVSMLARQQFENADSLEAAARRSRDQVRMAREIQPASAQPEPPAPAPAVLVPRWYPAAIVVCVILAVALLLIGAWAVGALVYMQQVTPISAKQVHYPLITWRLEVGTMGGFTQASRVMAWSMLVCLPVAALLMLMAVLLRRRVMVARKANRAIV